MPPQQTNSPPSPNPQYDFIFNEGQKPKSGFSPKLPGLPKPFLIGGIVLVIFTIILALVMFSGGSGNPGPWASSIGRAQEIARVSGTVIEQTTDLNTQALASTTQASLTSEAQELISYVQQAGIEVNPASVAVFENPKTDEELKAAAQENRLEEAYNDYLKESLASYNNALKEARAEAGPRGVEVTNKALENVAVILSAPQLAAVAN